MPSGPRGGCLLFVADLLCKLPTHSQAGQREDIDGGKTTGAGGGLPRKRSSQDGASPFVSPFSKQKLLMSPMLPGALSPPSNTESTTFAELKQLLEIVSNRQRWCQQSMEVIMAAQSSGSLRPSDVEPSAAHKKTNLPPPLPHRPPLRHGRGVLTPPSPRSLAARQESLQEASPRSVRGLSLSPGINDIAQSHWV
jgi:hypothetical protein